jgi:hypothetical protein
MLYDKHYNIPGGPMMDMEDYESYKAPSTCGCGCDRVMPTMTPGMGYPSAGCASPGCATSPVCEPPRERCINRCIVHEVPHICPINTKIINTHIFRHTYSPMYTCCEQNVVSHVQEGSCCNF